MRVQEIWRPDGTLRYLLIDDEGLVVRPVARYLKYLDNIGRARNTQRSYAYGLSLYFTYLCEKGIGHSVVSLDDLAGFVLWMKNPYRSVDLLPRQPVNQARASRTINHALTVITGFYDYLYRSGEEASDVNAATRFFLSSSSRTYKSFLHHVAKDRLFEANILKQKTPKKRPKTLPKIEIEALVLACTNDRDRLLITLLYESSLRVGESLALWLEDVDIPECRLWIRDRGPLVNNAEIKTPSAERKVDVSRDLVNQILNYVAVYHTEDVETNHLFLKLSGPKRGNPLGYPEVNDLFQRLEARTGIDATAHVLRHSSITALSEAGWLPEHLQERAGHAHYQTTMQMYVHPSAEKMREAWEKAMNVVRVDTLGTEDNQ